MDANSQKEVPPEATGGSSGGGADAGDWRNQIQPEARQRIVDKIMGRMNQHSPTSVPEVLTEMRQIVVRSEENIDTAATSRSDYLRKISLKILSMETKTWQTAPISPFMSNSTGPNQNTSYPVSLLIQPQDEKQGQSLPMSTKASVGPRAGGVVDAGNWKDQLQPEARQRIVNKIMDTLKGCLPTLVPEALTEIRRIAVSFEEKMYTAATSQSDYLRKISLKMLSMEAKTLQTAPINPSTSNSAVPNQNSSDSASLLMQPQDSNLGQSLLMPPETCVSPGGGGAVNAGDWRNQLQPEARQRVVNKIMDTFKRHLPTSVPESLTEIQKIAVGFEEKLYSAATSQSDYFRRISLRLLSVERKTQETVRCGSKRKSF